MNSPDDGQLDLDAIASRITAHADHLGLTTEHLLLMAAEAIVDHIDTHGTLTLPILIGPPSPHCALCPFAQHNRATNLPHNVLRGDW